MEFKFDKNIISNYINYDLEMFSKIKAPLKYIVSILESKGNSITIDSLDNINLNLLKEDKGKNYDWSVIKYNNITLLLRRFRNHFTIFIISEKLKNIENIEFKKVDRSAIEFFVTDDISTELNDMLFDNPFFIFNNIIKDLLISIENKAVLFCLDKPKYTELNIIFRNSDIYSFDKTIFCFEELDYEYNSLFAENSMLKKLDEFKNKIGEDFDSQHIIKSVDTDVVNDYYHGVGLTIQSKTNPEKTQFIDVYSLTYYYYNCIYSNVEEKEFIKFNNEYEL